MKAVLITVAALIVGYFLILGPGNKKKQTTEDDRRLADQIKVEELRRDNARAEKENAAAARKERIEREVAAEMREQIDKKTKEFLDSKQDEPLNKDVGSVGDRTSTPPATTVASPEKSPAGDQSSEYLKHADKLFIVSGNVGKGSGFICDLGGKSVALTNAHVISGQSQLTFVRPDGQSVQVIPDQLEVAMDRDLAMFPLKAPQQGLRMATGTLDVGDEIVCLGNSQGKSVITHLPGKILGIGPETIEIDAQFVGGNSGCPTIRTGSGEVVGVATLLTQAKKDWTTKGTRFEETRRFSVRIDGAKWKRVGWSNFAADAKLISRYQEHRENLVALTMGLRAGTLQPDGYEGYEKCSLGIKSAVRTFIAAATNPKVAQPDRVKAQTAFLREVIFELSKGPFDDIETMKAKASEMCSIHREDLTTEIRFHEEMIAALKAAEGATISIAGATTPVPTPARKPKSTIPLGPQ